RSVGDVQLGGREHRGVGGDVVGVLAGGEGDAVAVGDLAALGGQHLADVAVLFGLGRVGARVDGLHLHQAHHEGEEDQGQREADQAQPGARAAQLDGLGGRAGRSGAAGGAGAGRRAAGGAPAGGPGGAGHPAARRFPGGHFRHLPGAGEGAGAGAGAPVGTDAAALGSGTVAVAIASGAGTRGVPAAAAGPGTPLTLPSGPRKAGSPPGTMPRSRARRWRASGAEWASMSRWRACSSSVRFLVSRLRSSSSKAPSLSAEFSTSSPISPPPRRRTTRWTKGVRAARTRPAGRSCARRAALPLSSGFLFTHAPLGSFFCPCTSPRPAPLFEVLPDALGAAQPCGGRAPVLGDLLLGGEFGTSGEQLEPGLV